MNSGCPDTQKPAIDPTPPNWQTLELLDTWADRLRISDFSDIRVIIQKARGKKIQGVELPEGFTSSIVLPKYLLQEFHNIPNGNYSKKVSRGYIKGFEHSMLGHLSILRRKIALDLGQCHSILDVGCGGGHSTNALYSPTVKKDIWGLDPSPYLLQHAAANYPNLKLVQGLAEDTPFRNQRFDGISVSFVFHEIPPKHSNTALQEFHRILKPGGLISIGEPAPDQLQLSYLQMLKKFGWRGIYFRLLAKRVYEPFVQAWHNKDYAAWANLHGFELIEDRTEMPIRYFVLKKR